MFFIPTTTIKENINCKENQSHKQLKGMIK